MASPFDDEMPSQRQTEGRKPCNSPFRNTTSVANLSCVHFSCSSVERHVDWMEFKQKRRNRILLFPEVPLLFLLFGPTSTSDIKFRGFSIIIKGICYKIIWLVPVKAGKGVYCQAWWPELIARTHGGGRELTPKGYLLVSTYTLSRGHAHMHAHT